MHLRFIAIFASVRKHEEKNQEKIKTLAARISEMAGVVSFKLGMWTPLAGGKRCSKVGFNRIRDH